MRFDEAGQQRHPRQFDHLGVGGGADFSRGPHGFNALAAHQHHPAVTQLRGFAVEYVSGLEQVNDIGLNRSRRLSPAGRISNHTAQYYQDHVTHIRHLL